MIPSITTAEVKKLLQTSNISLIDIRDASQYKMGTIGNAINVPGYLLLSQTNQYLDMSQTYYIFCQRGVNSKLVVAKLLAKGYKVVNVTGGYQSYI